MFLRRLVPTVGAVAAVAFCADTASRPKFQRQNSAPAQQAAFRTRATSIADRAKSLYKDTDWKHYQTSKEFKVYYKDSPDHKGGEVFRVDLTVDSPLDTVVSVLLLLDEREQWDKEVEEHVIEDLGEGVAISHAVYETTGVVAKLISPRDFCRIELVTRNEDGTVSMAYDNVDHPGCQALQGFVRGEMFTSGVFCATCKEDPSKTNIAFFVQSDAKVYIPGYLLRMTTCQKLLQIAEDITAATEKAAKQPKK